MASLNKFIWGEDTVNDIKLGLSDVKIYLGEILVYSKNENNS